MLKRRKLILPLAVFAIGLLLPLAGLVLPTNSKAASDQDGSIKIKISSGASNAYLVAHRQEDPHTNPATPMDYVLPFNSTNKDYESPHLDYTNSQVCNGSPSGTPTSLASTFVVTAYTNSSKSTPLGHSGDIQVCGGTGVPKDGGTIQVVGNPAQFGTVKVVAKLTIASGAVNCTNRSNAQVTGPGTFGGTADSNGVILITNVKPGTYTLRGTCIYLDPGTQLPTQADFSQTNVVVSANKTTTVNITVEAPGLGIIKVSERVTTQGALHPDETLGNDTITLNTPDGKTITSISATPCNGTSGCDSKWGTNLITYTGSFKADGNIPSGVSPGNYLICGNALSGVNNSQLKNGCLKVTKVDGKTLAVTLSGNQTDESQIPLANAGDNTADVECANNSATLAWIICPMARLIEDGLRKVYNGIISPLLNVDPVTPNTEPAAYSVWKAIRDMADVFFVLIFFVIIFANTLSLNIDAYTIKKTLPRLVAAAILIQASFFIASVFVDIGNIAGYGITAVISQALPHTGTTQLTPQAVADGWIIGIIGVSGIIAGFIFFAPALLMFLLGLALAFLALLLTLVMRQIIILVLVVGAPIAFLAWVLPGTQKAFKMWWENLVKLNLMFPMIAFLLGAGALFNRIFVQSGDGQGDVVKQTMGILAPIIVFFMIPMTFKWSGKLMSSTSSAIQKRSSGVKKGIQSSGAIKNWKESNKEKGYLRSQQSKSRFMRFGGKVQGGGWPFGKTARRKQQSGYQKAQKTVIDEVNDQILSDRWSADEMEQMLLHGKDGKTFEINGKKVKVDELSRRAFLEQLAMRGDSHKFRNVREAWKARGPGGEMSESDERVYGQAHDNKFKELNDKDPGIARGASAYDSVTAQDLSKMRPEAIMEGWIPRLKEHLRASQDTTLSYEERWEEYGKAQSMLSNYYAASKSPALAASFSHDTSKAIRGVLGRGAPGFNYEVVKGEPRHVPGMDLSTYGFTTPDSEDPDSMVDFLQYGVDAQGAFTGWQPGAPKPTGVPPVAAPTGPPPPGGPTTAPTTAGPAPTGPTTPPTGTGGGTAPPTPGPGPGPGTPPSAPGTPPATPPGTGGRP